MDSYGDLIVPCDQIKEMPTVSFLYGGYWMEMRPEDYLVEYAGECFACVGSDPGNTWLLGDAFLRGFYSTHDHASLKFGFAPHAKSTKTAPYEGSRPYLELYETAVGGGEIKPKPKPYGPGPRPTDFTQNGDPFLSGAEKVFLLVLLLAIILIVCA